MIVWICVWVLVVGALAFFGIRERRSGRRVAPDAVRRRRDDTFRMQASGDFYAVPPKDPKGN